MDYINMSGANKNNVAKEILAILQAEYECAESLKATSVEIERLLREGRFELIGERLHARGEILNLMQSLDKQWNELAKCYKGSKYSPEWKNACARGETLRTMMNDIMGQDSNIEKDLRCHLNETGNILKTCFQGRKMMNSYGKDTYKLNRPQTQGVIS